MHHDNDNEPRTASDFSDSPEGLAARRAFLQAAPATHANHREVRPVETWAKREKDEETFLALQLPFMDFSESMGNHDSKMVGADSVD
jgi:hypothetical protein